MDAAVGDSIETFLVGNAPLGHWEERRAGGAPATASGEAAKEGAADGGEGARVEGGGEGTNFYLRAQWLDGDLRLEQRYKDHMWLTKVRRVGRAALVVCSILLSLLVADCRRPAAGTWQWHDGADGEMGLMTRGEFATELFNLDYFVI